MGAGFAKTKMIVCTGQLVTNKLDQVFKDPGSSGHPNPKYQFAKDNNTFDRVQQNVQDNWKDLLIAYVVAGVDVGNEWPAWAAYLEALGTGPQGPQNIYLIAQTRWSALNGNQGVQTKTHGGGGPVQKLPASGGNPITIDSPCPPQ
jgi:hypothetical protein